ncbi:MAG: DUF3084 domain-containing protein [Cyanophyceae cyanobacterium]
MTSAWILIASILLLGGLIAALGDRLGTKVGKARLRLFNLRPRQTAMVVTVITGTTIASLTLAILFTLSESLRKGIFDLDEILAKRREIQQELERVSQEKEQVVEELAAAQARQAQAQQRLDQINQNFQQAQEQLKTISSQAQTLREDISSLLNERSQLVEQRDRLDQQATQLQEQLQKLEGQLQQQDQELAELGEEIGTQSEILATKENRLQQLAAQQERLQTEIAQRDSRITQLDRAIATRDRVLQSRETKLEQVEAQLTFLRREVEDLERYYQEYQELRQSRIALLRGQVLAFASVRVDEPNAVISVIDKLLQEANRTAIRAVSSEPDDPNYNQRVVVITKAQVEQLKERLEDGQDYVVRIIAARNYAQGEDEIRVFADLTPNREIFDAGEEIATVSVDVDMNQEDLQKRLDLLLSASRFRARSAGVLGEIEIEDGLGNLVNFVELLNQSDQAIEELQAVALDNTNTAGPLKLRLIAIQDGRVLFST